MNAVREYRRNSGGTIDGNTAGVLAALSALKTNGRAAIIVPVTVCHAPKYQHLRQWIGSNARVRAAIYLPAGVFEPYTADGAQPGRPLATICPTTSWNGSSAGRAR